MGKFYRILLILFLFFVLVACGDNQSNSQDENQGENQGEKQDDKDKDDPKEEVIYRTVKFDLNGGTANINDTTITVEDGSIISVPIEPFRDGYIFEGWYLGNVQYNFYAQPVTSDIVLTAHWSKIKLSIKYAVDGNVYYEITKLPGESLVSISVKNPSKEGYNFVGWSRELPNIMPYDNIYIEALWEPIYYTLTINYNDGVTESLSVEKQFGDMLDSISPPFREGYDLDMDSLYSIPSTMPAYDLTIDLNWIPNEYTVAFYYEDGINEPLILVKEYESSFTIDDPTREGYIFKGWSPAVPSTIPYGGGEYFAIWEKAKYTLALKNYYGTSDKILNLEYEEEINVDEPQRTGYYCDNWNQLLPSTMPASDLTIEISWSKYSYSLVLYFNDGTESTNYMTFEYDEKIEGITDPTRDGYTFAGWCPALPSKMPAEYIYVSATWSINEYTVTLDYNDEVSQSSSIKKDYLQTLSDLSDPSREGYTFIGWYYNDIEWDMDEGEIDKDITLVAHWKINKYLLSIDYGKNQGIVSKYYEYNTAISISDPKLKGHTFVSWDVTVPEKMPAYNLTITASWSVNEYTITMKYNDGITEDHTQTFDYDEEITNLYIPDARDGYYFSNWSETVPTYMPDSDLTLNAVWKTLITYSINTQTNEVAVTGCTDLNDVVIWSEYQGYPVTSIASQAFMNKGNITSITIPDSIINIGAKAFYGCTSIEEITLPTNLVSIEEDLFNGCTSLKEISIPSGIERIMTGAFNNCENLEYNTYDNALYLPNAENPYYILIKAINNNITSCTINENCVIIYDNAFYSCADLDMITIPNSVKRVGVNSFKGYAYRQLTVKLNFTSLETLFNINLENCGSKDSGFYPNYIYLNNVKVEDLVIPNTITDTQIRFKYCSAVGTLRFSNQMTEIKSEMFYQCVSFYALYIPVSIVKFNAAALLYTNISNYYYEGTMAQWDAIEKHKNWFICETGDFAAIVNYTIHCSDGNITGRFN